MQLAGRVGGLACQSLILVVSVPEWWSGRDPLHRSGRAVARVGFVEEGEGGVGREGVRPGLRVADGTVC